MRRCSCCRPELERAMGGVQVLILCTLMCCISLCSGRPTVASAVEKELHLAATAAAPASQQAPASFVFGDSLVDAGNNNFLSGSLATARSLPNGIDFPSHGAAHPTGRFTNGLTIPDLVGAALGAPSFAPPVLAPSTTGSALLHGVNYASGGAGILNETGRIFLRYISMDQQITYFEGTVSELTTMLGVEETTKFLARALFSITIGANDFMSNYLIPIPTTKDRALPPEALFEKLIDQFRVHLTRLYRAGARKMVVVNVPLIGCTPYLRSFNLGTNGSCSSRANQLAQGFNGHLKSLLEELNAELPGATLLYADAYGITEEIISNYKAYGFANADTACCGLAGSEKGVVPCRLPFVPMCDSRDLHFFWDPYHPSMTACRLIAAQFLDGSRFISPFNIRHLVNL